MIVVTFLGVPVHPAVDRLEVDGQPVRSRRMPKPRVGTDPEVIARTVLQRNPNVLVLGDVGTEGQILELCRILDRERADLGVVLVREPSPELWSEAARVGVREIVDPVDLDADLSEAVMAAAERSVRLRAAIPGVTTGSTEPGRRVVAVLSPKGGSGKTMVASNVAAAWARETGRSTAVVDLDCMFGDIPTVFGVEPERNLSELVPLGELDATTLKVLLTPHKASGAFLLCNSGRPEDAEAVSEKLAADVINGLADEFDVVVVDTAAGLDERALAALEYATDYVFVASMDVTSIKNLVAEIDIIDRLGLNRATRHLAVNRADDRSGMTVSDVEKAVGLAADLVIPNSSDLVLSMNQGEPVVCRSPKSAASRAFVEFVQSLDGGDRADGAGRKFEWPRKRRH